MVQAHPGTNFFFVFLFTFLLFFKFLCKTFTFNVYVTKCVNRITVDFWETKSISTLKTLKTVLEKFEGFKKACLSKVLTYLMMAIFLLRQKKKNSWRRIYLHFTRSFPLTQNALRAATSLASLRCSMLLIARAVQSFVEWRIKGVFESFTVKQL